MTLPISQSVSDDQEMKVTRREAAQRIGVAGLAAGLAVSGISRVGAQSDATPAPTDAIPAVIQAWADAQNAHDADAHAALYTADAVLEDVPNNAAVKGPAIHDFLVSVLKGMNDITVEIQHAFQAGNWGAAEYLFSATNNGLIPIPGTLDKRWTSRTVTIFEFDGDKIRRSSDYYDQAGLLQQLGVGGPGGPGEVPAASATPVS